MIISDTAIKNRISVLVLVAIILIIGTISYVELPRESEPDITIPYVFVSTSYKGVSSSDIETSITIKIENKLKGLEGVKKVKSVSSEGQSNISIEFMPDIDIDDALQKVKDKVDEAKQDLPTDLDDEPSIYEVNFSEFPIVVFLLSGTCGNPCLKELADDLQDEIESIKGVLEVEVTGGLEREIRIEVDPDKLAYYGIPITLFQSIISTENKNSSGGAIKIGQGRYNVRVPGEFEKPEEILNLVVTTHNGQPVYLKDVAKVSDSFKEETSRVRLDGKEAVSISVKKRTGENIIEITDAIDKIVERKKAGWPKGTKITKLMDNAREIRMMVSDLENNIFTGLFLVIVVLFFALGVRNAVLVSLAIPFSMLISFMVFSAIGLTLNSVVLFSLTLSLGMLVDNAIVIIENIYRYMEQGVSRLEAAMKATSEVAYPVIGSTLTTLAAFAPLVFWPGIMGEFMKYLPITLLITLSSSLFVAMVINPALASMLVKVKGKSAVESVKSAEEVQQGGEKPVEIKGIILKTYAKILNGALNHRPTVLLISLAFLIIFILMWLFRVGLERPVELFPSGDPKSIYVNIDAPRGANLEYIDKIVREVEKEIAVGDKDADYEKALEPKVNKKADGTTFMGPSNIEDVEHIYAKAIDVYGTTAFEQYLPNHIGVQFLDFKDRNAPSTKSIENIRKKVSKIVGCPITVTEDSGGPPTGSPINIEISGTDVKELGEIAKKIKKVIANVPFIEDIEDDYIEGIPSIEVNIDRQKAALMGLSTYEIGFALKTAYNGIQVSTYYEGDEDFDITVILKEQARKTAATLNKLMIPTPSGQLVPLTAIAKIEYSGILGDIIRIDNNRVVTVKANVDETNIPGPVARIKAQELLKDFKLPPGYKIKFTGEFEFQQESQEFLSKAFLYAIFLIFLILVTLFNSVSQPVIILTSVTLSLGGAFLGLFFLALPFGIVMTGVGVISLAGVVVNNAIVLIDYTNKLVERGMRVREAIIAAGATRLRPVLLTAITTILGLIPMLTGVSFDFHDFSIATVSESSQYWQSMAAVVIFGLLVSTILTLLVVPTCYSFLEAIKRRVKALSEKINITHVI